MARNGGGPASMTVLNFAAGIAWLSMQMRMSWIPVSMPIYATVMMVNHLYHLDKNTTLADFTGTSHCHLPPFILDQFMLASPIP